MIPATASSAITRKSQASASSNAPPSAAPWIWQIGGLRHLLEQVPPGQDPAPEGAQVVRVLGEVAQVVQVHARREHRRPRRGRPRTRTAGVGGRGLGCGAEVGHELPVQRVALLGPAQNEVADRSAILDGDEWHVGSPRSERLGRRGRLVEIKKVGVLGCGLMGHGITQVAAQAGYDVVVREVDQARRSTRGSAGSRSSSPARWRRAAWSRATPTRCAAASTGTLDYADLADCDLVIEAITENLGKKLEMWREVDAHREAGGACSPRTRRRWR